MAPVNELNWFWIALALMVPTLVGGLVAFPLWQKGQPILGNAAGTIVIFGGAARRTREMGFVLQGPETVVIATK